MRKKIAAIFLIVLSLGVMLCSCGNPDVDISSYADSEIIIKGLADEDIVVTIADLKGMKAVTKKTHSTSDKIGEVKATGVELGDLLANYGYEKADFSKVIFKGTDQYDVKLLNDYIVEHDMILAYGIDGEPLDEESAPCRLIIPRSDSAYWIRMINEIDFIK